MYTGKDITGIRKIPQLREQVENLIDQVQDRVPSLDRRPTAGVHTVPKQVMLPPSEPVFTRPNGLASGSHSVSYSSYENNTEDNFIYLRRSDGSVYRVPVINEGSVQDLSPLSRQVQARCNTRTKHTQEDPLASSDEDCPIVPKNGWHHVWRRTANGDKYFIEEPVKVGAPQTRYEWVRDPKSGRTYKQQIEEESKADLELRTVIDPSTGAEVQMLVPVTPSRLVTSSISEKLGEGRTQRQSGHRVHHDQPQKAGGSSHLSLGEDKQGKDSKTPLIVQYARNCPVAWTSRVTSDKMNMGLWCWSYIAEILATRTGVAPPLQQGELEARLQHFLNVLEIALQPSNPSEYDGQSWRVARLYAEKVQHKVDRGGSWVTFEERYGADSHPHELMAAQIELAPKQTKLTEPKDPKKIKDGKEKPLCTTWNTCPVENKCRYEVDNEGKQCNRKHECSYCRETTKKSFPHQRSFCRQRIGAGEQ